MPNQPNLTFISPRFLLPADSGGKIRTTQVLRGMKGGRFRITLVMPAPHHEFDRNALDALCDEVVYWEGARGNALLAAAKKAASVLDENPIPVVSDWSRNGAAAVAAALAARPDVVVFDFPHSAILASELGESPAVMFTHNIESEIFKRHLTVAKTPLHRLLWRNQYAKMLRYERRVLEMFDMIVAVSDRDRVFFEKDYGVATPCRTIPTGVDTEFFRYAPPSGRAQVVFCGSMDWLANIDGVEFFFDEVWPSVRREVPHATMRVVGRTPPEALVRRVRSSAPEWEFTGFVDDVRDHVSGADAFVIPLRVGGGTRIKAFEAMAMGSPVVSTTIGVEGLPLTDGVHYLRADTADELAARVVALLRDAELRNALSTGARQLVQGEFGFRRAARTFEDICVEAMSLRNVRRRGR